MSQTVKARFWAKVNKQGPRFGSKGRCWLWTAHKGTKGYGQFKVNGRVVEAHCFAYGPVPDGLELDHLCRRGLCVRRSHLEAVTHAENLRRGESPSAHNSTKTQCLRKHPLSGANLYVRPDGKGRDCRKCHRDRQRVRQHYQGAAA